MSRPNILDEIIEYKHSFVEKAKVKLPLNEIKDNLGDIKPAISFIDRLKLNVVQGRISLIAEIKKASPSKGLIRKDFNPAEIARTYKSCNATAISVLTDEKFFQGSLNYFDDVRKTVNLPLLRKDFIVDEYQIYESKLHGADIILLISNVLEKNELLEYHRIANSLGMEVLVEVHTEDDFDFYLNSKIPLIGINNRDLKSFKTDINHTIDLLQGKHTCNSFIISESGISTFEDIKKLTNSKISGILVGESFMREDNIYKAVQKLMNPEENR